MAFSPEENMLEVQRSLGRIEGTLETFRNDVNDRFDAVGKRLAEHIDEEEEFRKGVEEKERTKTSNRTIILSGIIGSGIFSWFLTYLLTRK